MTTNPGFGRRAFLAAGGAALVLPLRLRAQDNVFRIRVSAGPHPRKQTPVRMPLEVPASFAAARTAVLEGAGAVLDGQVVPGDTGKPELSFILPELAAGASAEFRVTLLREPRAAADAFGWDAEGVLAFGKRPVLRYMNAPLDESSGEARERTYKVFHHAYDPRGERLLTKGAGGKFTHHRGIFYGFNKVTYGDGKNCDVWHCTKDAHQSHQEILESAAGPVLGRHRVRIGWHGIAKELFAHEERELTAYATAGGSLIDFVSRLRPIIAPVKLDGDPQHAGFHFRADGEVADKTSKETRYIRPDGAGRHGETRNWPAQKGHVNLPWNAMNFMLADRRYTVAYLDRPDNPKEARFSERDYGRFGSYFSTTLEAGTVLVVRYRLWIQEGDATPAELEARSQDFLKPVESVRL
jgi:hypothetical protein